MQFRLHLGRGNPQLAVESTPDINALSYVEIRGPYNPKFPAASRKLRPSLSLRPRARAITRWPAPAPISPISRAGPTAGRSPTRSRRPRPLRRNRPQQQGDSIDQGMQLALEAILVSPRFLFRIEPAGHLDDFQFASRLSYFLWSSMPDEELFQLALTTASAIPKCSTPKSIACYSIPNRALWSKTLAANGSKPATWPASSPIP